MQSKNTGYLTALDDWLKEPHKFGHLLGFTKLNPTHDIWIREFIRGGSDEVRIIQAHRGAYKTTAGLVALTLLFMCDPELRIQIVRKSLTMAKKLVMAMDSILNSDIVRYWFHAAYGCERLSSDQWSATALRLSIARRKSPEPSLQASGIQTNQTGDHFDIIWSDDIITPDDRYSAKEREKTANYINETGNIIEPKGFRIFTGTVWHPQDGWRIIEAISTQKKLFFPVGTVPLDYLTKEWIAKKMKSMPKSLWSANMALKHEKDTNPVFNDPHYESLPKDADVSNFMFIDAAFGGKDCTAIWIGCNYQGKKWMRKAFMYRKSIGNHWNEIENLFWANNVQKIFYENNGAQKLIGDELNRRNLPSEGIPSTANKYAKITNTLLPAWDDICWDESLRPPEEVIYEALEESEATPHPMVEILEFTEDAEHDDSPDSATGLVICLDTMSGIPSMEALLEFQSGLSG
jgi:hypothetical protein